jgi:hypothetical protein
MKKFQEFVNERFEDEPVFTYERAKKWFERIKQDPQIQPYIGAMIMNDDDYNKFKKIVRQVLFKYRTYLYPKEIEYVRELLYDVVFDLEDETNEDLMLGQKPMPGLLEFPEIGTNEHPELRVESDIYGYKIAEEHLKKHPQVTVVHSKEEYDKAIQNCRFFSCGHSWVNDEKNQHIPYLDMIKQFGFVFGVYDDKNKIGYVIPYDQPDRKKR